MTTQGIGVRMPRKEDARHLHGRGSFVSDMILPGQSEVAFLRSPVAHGRLRRIVKPAGREDAVFTREDLVEAQAMVAPTTVPGYKLSALHPLAHDKVRFVGEAIAMCVAPTRAEAEDLTELIDVEFDELPVLVDAHAARAEPSVRIHEEWADNSFLTLNFESGFDAKAKGAPVVVRREVALSRQAMVPMEGKVVLAYWDERTDQLVVYASTQVPHVIRIGLAQFLGLDHGKVRVVSPDVGGGFGYKVVVQPEELCVAWLALKFRKPFRYIEDRREHLVVGANARQHHYSLTGYADERGRLLALDAEVDDRRRRLFDVAVHGRARARPGDRQPARPVRVPRLSLQDPLRRHQQAGLPALSRGGAHRRLLRHGADDRRHRPCGRPRAVGGAPRQPGAGRRHAVRQRDEKALRQRRLPEGAAHRARQDRPDRVARAAGARRARRAAHRHRLCLLLRAERPRGERVRRLGPADRSGLRRGDRAGDRRRRARGSCRRALARPGHGDDARPDRGTRSSASTSPTSG